MTPDELRDYWERTPEVHLVVDDVGRVHSANPAARDMGITPGASLDALVDTKAARRIARLLRRASAGHAAVAELSLRSQDSDHRCLVQAVPLGDGRIAIAGRDVTRLRAQEAERIEASQVDALTGLPNRALFRDRLLQALRRAQRIRAGVGLMYLDIDDFKSVNDRFGHAFGDAVIIAVAERVTGALRSTDTLARLGGDEFIVVCEDLSSVRELETLAGRVRSAIAATPITVGAETAFVSASVGVTYAAAQGLDLDLFIRTADDAMYAAKRQGPGHQQRGQVNQRSERMLEAIRRSIETGSLPMAVQPIREVGSGAISAQAVDVALGPRRHTRAALESLGTNPAAMQALAMLAVRQALVVAAANPDGPLQVHVPLVALTDAGFRSSVFDEVRAAGVDPGRLIVAVDGGGARSERALMTVNHALDGELRLALMRFGKNTMDIAALAELQPEVCELDPGIVDLAETGQRARFDATCAVAHELGARTQAAGVPVDGHLHGIDQVRAPLGETLQKLAPLSIGR